MSTYISRRIQKEIKRDWDNDTNDIPVFFGTFNIGICNFVVFDDCLDFHHHLLQISIDFNKSTFPFTPPKNIKINNLDYFELIKFNSYNHEILERITGQKCSCCSSILCRNNWCTTNSMKDIIKEVIKNIKLKQRIIEITHWNKIINKYFGFYLPVIEYL